jgi:hypothetical protein
MGFWGKRSKGGRQILFAINFTVVVKDIIVVESALAIALLRSKYSNPRNFAPGF